VLVHEPDAVVVGGAPDARVRGDRDAEVARDLERRLLGEGRVPGDVEGHLHAHAVVAGVAEPLEEGADGGVGAPLPRAGLDVAVGHDEAAGHRPQRVDGRLAVVDGVQVVRPVDGRGDTGVQRLDRRQPVARRDVLGAELLAVLEVVPDEVLGQRPVGAVPAHRGLPHVPVRVDHARHDDPAPRVDLAGAFRDVQFRSDGGDAVVDDQDVGVGQDRPAGVQRQHRAAPQHDGPAGLERGLGLGHRVLLGRRRSAAGRVSAQRPAGAMRVTFVAPAGPVKGSLRARPRGGRAG
jgi:hypothetical protein